MIIYLLIFVLDIEVKERRVKVGFIITGNVTSKGWNESNYSGIKKAFTLGVQRVNPNAKVLVMRTGAWQDEETDAIHD